MRNVVFLTSSLAFLMATAAQAVEVASLSGVSGTILVNTGEGYVAAKQDQSFTLKPGDKVLVKEASFATLSFPECAVALSVPTVFTVPKIAPCGKNAQLPEQALVVTPTQDSSDAGGGLAGEAQVVGMAVSAAIVIGAGAVLIDALENDPASPN